MLSREEAQEVAREQIKRIQTSTGIDLTLVDADTVEFDEGWIFYWDSTGYLETGDFGMAIGGNAPFVIFKDGAIRQAPTAYAKPEAILKWLEENPDAGWVNSRSGSLSPL